MDTEDKQAYKNVLPDDGYVRLKQILGDKRKNIPPVIPISRSSWYQGQKTNLYPKPIMLSARCAVYRVEDIRALLKK